MPGAEYSFYKLNASGLVDSANAVRLPDDHSALAHARDMRLPYPVEVWAGRRRVALVPPSTERRAADRRG